MIMSLLGEMWWRGGKEGNPCLDNEANYQDRGSGGEVRKVILALMMRINICIEAGESPQLGRSWGL